MYIKKKNKQNKLSRKHNVSEILNSTNKTKKQYDARKHKLQAQKQKRGKNHNQEGGFPKFGKDPFNNTYDVSKSTESFDVANKVQYNRLKKDIRNTIFFSWINKKTGTITETAYELLKRLLKANLFFAKMKLENVKMLYNLDKLIKDKDSGLKKVQSIIDQIFELQRQIKNFYDPNKEGLKKQGIINKFTKLFKKKNDTIESLIHKQDKLRMKLMEYTMFNDAKDLSSKCDYSFGGLIGKALFKERSHRTTKKIICLLGKYRKNEGKFNRYYNLFHRQYEKFVAVFPSCKDTKVKDSTLFVLDITDDKKLNSIFENIKCDKEEIAKIFDDATNAAIKTSEKQLPNDKLQKSIDKDKTISDEYKKKGGKFKELIESFNKRLLIFKKLFSAAELYGIHHYKANIPKNKKLFKAFRTKENYLLKTNKLAKLAEEPVFINKFISIIDDLSKRAEPIFDKTNQDRKITDEVIPYIKIYDNVFANLKILSINIDNPDNDDLATKISTLIQNAITGKESFVYPNIICFQNLKTMLVEIKMSTLIYIPISYSLHSKPAKYNVIYIDTSIIAMTKDEILNIKPIDQSTYFILNYTPNNMKLEDVQKCFAAINLIIANEKLPIPLISKKILKKLGGGGLNYDCETEFTKYVTTINNTLDKEQQKETWYYILQDALTDEDEKLKNFDTLEKCFKTLGYFLCRANINKNYEVETNLILSIKKYKLQSIQSKKQKFSENVKNSSTDKLLQYDTKKSVAGREAKYADDIYEQMIKYKPYLNFIKTKEKDYLNSEYKNKYYTKFEIFDERLIENIFTEYNENQEKKKEVIKDVLNILKAAETAFIYEDCDILKSQTDITDCKKENDKNKILREKTYNTLNKKYPNHYFNDETFLILRDDNDKYNRKFKIYSKILDKLQYTITKLSDHKKIVFNDNNLNSINAKIRNWDKDYNTWNTEYTEAVLKYKTNNKTIPALLNLKTINTKIYDDIKANADTLEDDYKTLIKNIIDIIPENSLSDYVQAGGGNNVNPCYPYAIYNVILGMIEYITYKNIDASEYKQTIAEEFKKNTNIIFNYQEYLKIFKDAFNTKATTLPSLTTPLITAIASPSGTPAPPGSSSASASSTPGTSTSSPPPTNAKGITIVTTELIGSNPEKDLKEHLIDINNFSIDGSPNIQGLRQGQINKIFEVINLYTGRNPDIICGDFGGTLATFDKNILYDNVKRFIVNKDSITDVEDILELYYKNGMTELSGRMKNYEPHTSTPPTPKIEMTNSLDGMITNYIFHNIHHANVKQFGPQDDTNINDFGGILPIGVELKFDITNDLKDLQLTSPEQFIRKKGDSTIKTQLYTKAELTDILKVLDELMGNFGYGYKPFLKRDLGCFNIGDDSKYGKRIFNENTEDLQTFYSMNYPSFIETYLYQLSGFFNESSTANIFYNENQIAMKDTFTSRHSLNIFDDIKSKYGNNKIGMDIIVRMLLIPSNHLKAISGIDIIDKTSAVDFEGLSQKFCTQFYRDVVQIALEKRITELMAGTSGTPNVNYNFISKLKERNEEGHLTNIKDHSQSYTLITNLFEFIFIMLKLKYIDKQLESIGGSVSSSSPGGLDGVARPATGIHSTGLPVTGSSGSPSGLSVSSARPASIASIASIASVPISSASGASSAIEELVPDHKVLTYNVTNDENKIGVAIKQYIKEIDNDIDFICLQANLEVQIKSEDFIDTTKFTYSKKTQLNDTDKTNLQHIIASKQKYEYKYGFGNEKDFINIYQLNDLLFINVVSIKNNDILTIFKNISDYLTTSHANIAAIINNPENYIILTISCEFNSGTSVIVQLCVRTLTGKVDKHTCCHINNIFKTENAGFYDYILTSENCVSINKVQKAKPNLAIHLPVVGEIYLLEDENKLLLAVQNTEQTDKNYTITWNKYYNAFAKNQRIIELYCELPQYAKQKKYIGLVNPGIMCYQNAVINFLRAMNEFRELVNDTSIAEKSDDNDDCKKGIKIIGAFKAIEEKIGDNSEKSIKLINVKVGDKTVYDIIFDEALQNENNVYNINRQQDASEVIIAILQRLTACTETNQNTITEFSKLYKFKEEIEYKLTTFDLGDLVYRKKAENTNILKLDLFNITTDIVIQNLISNEKQSDEFVFPLNDTHKLETDFENFREVRQKELSNLNLKRDSEAKNELDKTTDDAEKVRIRQKFETRQNEEQDSLFSRATSQKNIITLNPDTKYIVIYVNRFKQFEDREKNRILITNYEKIQISGKDFHLKAVVLHKGQTIKSGHYVTFICDDNGKPVLQCDDSILSTPYVNLDRWNLNFKSKDTSIETDGYIYLYEMYNNLTVRNPSNTTIRPIIINNNNNSPQQFNLWKQPVLSWGDQQSNIDANPSRQPLSNHYQSYILNSPFYQQLSQTVATEAQQKLVAKTPTTQAPLPASAAALATEPAAPPPAKQAPPPPAKQAPPAPEEDEIESMSGGSLENKPKSNSKSKTKTKSKKHKKNTKSKQRKSNQKKNRNHKKTKKRIN